MKLIIMDKLRGKQKVIEDVTIIPRVGEFVEWDYQPTPSVKKVTYDFSLNEILIEIGVRVASWRIRQ